MAHRRLPTSVYAVILVGGIGKRLQPLSKPSRPKPFLSVTKDKKSIFAKTVSRISRIIPAKNIIVVANRSQASLVRNNFPKISKENLILEKASRNTAPAITLAALELKKRCPDVTMIVLPADHYIGNESTYLNTLKKGVSFIAGKPDALVTIGLKPRFPATGYGYIKITPDSPPGLSARRAGGRLSTPNSIHKVQEFVEKPDLKAAKEFVKGGKYLWNTGTFIFKAAAFLDAIRLLAADIYGELKDMRKIDEKYEALPNISVDYAVMEKAANIYCVRGTYLWEDIGSFDSLKKVLKLEGRRFLEKDGKVIKII